MSGSTTTAPQQPGVRQSQFKPADKLDGTEELSSLQNGENVNITPAQLLEFLAAEAFAGNVLDDTTGAILTTEDGLFTVTY